MSITKHSNITNYYEENYKLSNYEKLHELSYSIYH